MVRKGGPNDPVAENIRNQQNRDAMPTQEEIEQKAKKNERVHAQWKAVEVLLDRIGAPASAEVTAIVAGILGFDELEREAGSYHGFDNPGGPGFKTNHEESWEKPDEEEIPRQAQQRMHPPFDQFHDMERVRALKQQTFLRIQEEDFKDFTVAQRRIAPFGGKKAVAVEYKDTLHTNDVWKQVLDDDKWRDRHDEQTRQKYRERLAEELDDARHG